jgi:penicillin amidase
MYAVFTTAGASRKPVLEAAMSVPRVSVLGLPVILGSLLTIGWGGASAARTAAELKDARELARQSLSQIDGDLKVAGLQQPVDVIRDQWGVPHIYARNTDDLFLAQGYVMAQDRLWEMDWWRRQFEGRLAEVVGPKAFERDKIARLLMYRGPYDDAEWTNYHQDGKRIVQAYANGINAFINQSAGSLPVEFKLTGIRPLPWTPEAVVIRESAFGDAVAELRLAMSVARYGVKEANRRAAPDPWDDLKVPDGFDPAIVTPEVIAATRAPAGPLPKPEVIEPYRNLAPRQTAHDVLDSPIEDLGSNNWLVGPKMSPTGKPIVSNDPHRQVENPSLRYIVHLNAPGWNAIGASQPPFLGVSIGHNDKVAWGLTITGTDFQDVFVEDLNPANMNEVMYSGRPEPLKIIREEFKIKGESPRTVDMKFSRHGPIFYVDEKHHKAYALRSVFTEPGSASYLAALRLDQVTSCKDFLTEAHHWYANSENLICGDVDGNIAMQGSGYTPRRNGWIGRLPVPGTGKYEWNGPRADLPKEYNPDRGFIATANHNINPKGYWPPAMFKTTNTLPYDRITRILQVIKPGQPFSMEDSKRLQRDVYSLRGAEDREAFAGWTARDPAVDRARDVIARWDAMLTKDSVPAAIWMTWRKLVDRDRLQGEAAPKATRADVEANLPKTIEKLTADLGSDWSQWRYGRVHAQAFAHPVLRDYDLPAVERRGGNGAVGADGATYREIIDVANWDNSVAVNVPGQSGQPESPYYGNLLPYWENDEYFPLAFSRKAVDDKAAHRLTLTPW